MREVAERQRGRRERISLPQSRLTPCQPPRQRGPYLWHLRCHTGGAHPAPTFPGRAQGFARDPQAAVHEAQNSLPGGGRGTATAPAREHVVTLYHIKVPAHPSVKKSNRFLTVCCGKPGRGSDSPLGCHSLPRLRFAYPSEGSLWAATARCGEPGRGSDSTPGCHSLPRLHFAYPDQGSTWRITGGRDVFLFSSPSQRSVCSRRNLFIETLRRAARHAFRMG